MGLLSRVKRLWELSGETEAEYPQYVEHLKGPAFAVVEDEVRKPIRPATVVPDDPIELFPTEEPAQQPNETE
jgi:hypothetical protein